MSNESSKTNLILTAESHGLWFWINASAFGRDVYFLGRQSGASNFARGAPPKRGRANALEFF